MKNTFKKLPIIAIIAIITLGTAACASMSIASVDWDSLTGPARVRQYFNVNNQDVTVYALYKDGSRKEATFFSTSHNKEGTGIQTVTVNVIGQGTGTFQTEVMELTGIRIENKPSKTTYTAGEKADLAGIKVMGSWRDMPDAEVPSYEISVASFNSSTAGNDRPVTISYKGKTAVFHVNVVAAPPPAPVGTWRFNIIIDGELRGYAYYIFNANGTGTFRLVSTNPYSSADSPLTWTASGNKLTLTVDYGAGLGVFTINYTYGISGNTLTMQEEGSTNPPATYTRQ